MLSNHLILCCFLFLTSIFPSIRVFSSESILCIRWPKYWSFRISISPSNEYSGLISFRMDWLDLLAVQRTLKSLLQHHSHPNPCLLSRWCHPTISSSIVPISSCPQSFPASGSFQISQFFASDGWIIGVSASASVLPMDIQDWFPLGWTGWIFLLSKGYM